MAEALRFNIDSDVTTFSRAMALVESTAKSKAASFALSFTGAGKQVDNALGGIGKRAGSQISDALSLAAKKYESDFTKASTAVTAALTKASVAATRQAVVTSAPIAIAAAKEGFKVGAPIAAAAGGAFLKEALASSTVRTAAAGVAGIALAYTTVSAAIDQANAQLDRFINLGKNSERAGVGVEFFQRFSEAAAKAKIDVAAIEAALLQAGKIVTPKFEESDPIRNRLSDLFESGYLGDRQSQGLADYRKAGTNEDRIRAAVRAMQELQQAGERLAAIDLAERLFGTDVADRIRSGRLEIEAIAASLDKKREDLITQAQVDQAQEFRDRLSEAYKQINDALLVSVALEGSGRGILGAWLGIVEATAKALTNATSFLERMGKAIDAARGGVGMTNPTPPLATGQRGEGQGSIAADLGAEAGRGARGRTIYDKPIGPELPAMTIQNPPEPPRRPLDVVINPEKYGIGVKPRGGAAPSETLNQLENYINGLERSTAALKGEMDALGKDNAERLTSINLARAEELAKQQGITLTEQQTAKIREASVAQAAYKDAIEKAHEAQDFVRSAGGSFFKDLADGARSGVSAIEAISNALSRLATRMADRALDKLSDLLFGKSGGSGTGLIGSVFTSIFAADGYVPKYATGVSGLGLISGPGDGRSDSILAMGPKGPIRVSNGESIVTAKATRDNRPLIEAMNAGKIPPGLAQRLASAETIISRRPTARYRKLAA